MPIRCGGIDQNEIRRDASATRFDVSAMQLRRPQEARPTGQSPLLHPQPYHTLPIMNRFAMIRRRLPLPSSGAPFLSCFHFVSAFHFLRKHQTNRLRLSPDLLPQSCGLKSLKYTKYSCASQALSCAKISHRTLLLIDSEFPNISSKPFGIWAKNSGNTLRRSFFCVAVIPAICGRCAQKRNPAETCPADMAILPEIVKA